jgi:hypothetical protein
MEDWNLQERSSICSECNTPFADKSAYHTVLSFNAEGYHRRDICHTCWDAAGGRAIRDKAGVFSYWEGIFEPPPPPPVDPLPREDAETLLRRMLNHPEPDQQEALYILAVMLERKRIFRHRETQNFADAAASPTGQPGKVLVYEHLKTGEVFMISDPQLRLDQLAQVQDRVATMLRPPTPASPAPPTETPAPAPAVE